MNVILKFICILVLILFAHNSRSQELKLRFEEKTEIIRKGDFIQCIAIKPDASQVYSFGKVANVGLLGMQLKKNPILSGSGGFVEYKCIQKIAKIKIVKKSIFPALAGGYIIGQLMFINSIPTAFGHIIGGGATYLLLLHAIKYNRNGLRKNRVNETVFITPPSQTQFNGELYFENN
ncbi:hypothetical protein [Dyadobacter aurulentus]|uniref:hypothetical protein n=1 Tax=Dyadobacter sp. UC 10 TaxID=2605428 RepID=UPI0011F36379|nr:hypothetical protein [Dyadobacter sp. UC 10]KAA0989797.1 hypothetical protein FXO21_06265 [Dyadobacter sp. UC 10]